MPLNRSIALAACAWLVWASVSWGGDLPPADAKPLSQIIKALEDAGYDAIVQAEFNDGVWEVEARREGRWVELHLDPRSGELKHEKPEDAPDKLPPGDGSRLSEIIQSVEGQNIGVITEVEFDDGQWVVELEDGGKEIKVKIDPATGQRA